jgi:hypothetical protein
MRDLGDGNGHLWGHVQAIKRPTLLEIEPSATTTAELLAAHNHSVVSRLTFFRAVMLNHWYHHRVPLTVYLRERDVPLPSIYGPGAHENPFF